MTSSQEAREYPPQARALLDLADKYASATMREERTRATTGSYPSQTLAADARMALQEALRSYVDADRKARQQEALPDDMPKTWELSYQFDDECDGSGGWRVHNVVGYPNDREWQLVGAGSTPSEAIRAAIAKGERHE